MINHSLYANNHSLYAIMVLIERFIIHYTRMRIIKRYDLLCIIGFSPIVFKNCDIIGFTMSEL
jgi:hypothetical protein